MSRKSLSVALFRVAVGLCLTAALALGAGAADFTVGKVNLKSASQLAFGPSGVLFIGDSLRGTIFAIDTGDTKVPSSPVKIEVMGINEKIAAMLGVGTDQILINDVKANPISRNVYVAVSRGRGADGTPVILKIDAAGKMTEFSLNNVKFAAADIADAPVPKPDAPAVRTPEGPRSGNPRVETVTDLSFVDGKVIVAGVSNQEFASDLRVIPYPFAKVEQGTGIRIWHASHGRYETAAPVRTFVPYTINKEQFILASYTCTPLVKIPVSALKPGAKVLGTTIAELGNSNRPLEMVPYKKDGHEYILMANSKRGVMKVSVDNLGSYSAITPPTAACEESTEAKNGINSQCGTQIAGVPYQSLNEFNGVWQMTKLDDTHALVLADSSKHLLEYIPGNASSFTPEPGGVLDLKTITLP